MSGAACESIYLSLSIAKKGSEEEVLKLYRGSNGRKQLQKLLEHGQPSGLVHSLDSGFTVLAHWRDLSAHGARANVGQPEALVALNTLHNLAKLAADRWDDLTKAPTK